MSSCSEDGLHIMTTTTIPRIDIGPLFGPASASRDATDRAIMDASSAYGFMTVTGLPPTVPIDPATRRNLLRLFALPAHEQRMLWRQKFDPAQPNVYRGWFPKQEGAVTCKEGIDMGPDCAHGPSVVDTSDPLREATPLPAEAALPGWRATVTAYYRGMELTGRGVMRSVARGLGLEETAFDQTFEGGISTLRLIHYPQRSAEQLAAVKDPDLWVMHHGKRVYVSGKAHVDSGFVTLLAQDGVAGLQARAHDGTWLDVEPREGTLAVNFGKVLELWTGGRIKATEHRVIGTGQARHSIPFFYEPRVDAEVAPLDLPGSAPFAPFLYGDHLWAATTKFVEFHGMEGLRKPRRAG
jgi:isopenicillin N synthase-like dioxygenase